MGEVQTYRLAVVVPAYNEEAHLPSSIAALHVAGGRLPKAWSFDVVVVDDQSDDLTGLLAEQLGATVICGPKRGIGAARNFGAAAAHWDVLVFVDADTLVSPDDIAYVAASFIEEGVEAIVIPANYATNRALLKPLLAWWRWYAPRHNSTQGVFQAFSAQLFEKLEGYDESLYMAEDTDLFDRAVQVLPRHAWRIATDRHVTTSMRRYEQQSTLSLWLLTNPLTTKFFRRWAGIWSRWYDEPPR